MSGWIAKLRAQTLRIAALLHIAEGRGQQDEIDEHGLARAFVLADYFIEHSKAIHAVWNVGSNPVLQRARKIIEWVIREGITTFTASDLQSKQRRNFEVIKDTVEPLTWLVEAGWLRAESGLPVRVGQPGKPSPAFIVRPDVRDCANGAEPVDGSAPAVDANGANPEVQVRGSAPFAPSRRPPLPWRPKVLSFAIKALFNLYLSISINMSPPLTQTRVCAKARMARRRTSGPRPPNPHHSPWRKPSPPPRR
jgi:hypothetical protein